MTTMERIALFIAVINTLGWLITLSAQRYSRIISTEHLNLVRLQLDLDKKTELELIGIRDAYDRGYAQGKLDGR